MTTETKTAKAAKKEVAAAAPAAPAKQNAVQKMTALENAFMQQNQQINTLADEIDRLRQLLTAVNKRLNASIQASEEGGLTGASVNKIIMDGNIKD